MAKAIVVGGGIVGLATALRLLEHGLRVCVVNPAAQNPAAASWGNAGHIAIEQVAPLASLHTIQQAPIRLFSAHGGLSLPLRRVAAWLPFSLRLILAAHRFEAGKAALKSLLHQAVPAWQRLVQALGEPQLVRFDGHFVTWSDRHRAQAGRRQWLSDDIGSAGVRDATADELQTLSALAPGYIAAAIRFSGTGQIRDFGTLQRTMRERIAAAGCETVEQMVSCIGTGSDGTAVQLDDSRILNGDIVVITAGVNSRPLLEGLGHRVPMIAERGYHLEYRSAHWPEEIPPVVFEDRAMIATRFASRLRICGFVEFSTPEAPADSGKWRRLARNVEELGITREAPVAQWFGSRPTLPDYLPAIGRSRHAANLFYAFGHQHLGLTLGPLTAELVTALITGETVRTDLAPFDLERFS